MSRTEAEPLDGAWRYPELAVRMRWLDHVEPRERARLIARGIAERHTPVSAVETLYRAGEFEVAEEILDGIANAELIDESAAERLARRLAVERNDVQAMITAEAQVLRERAQRVDLTDLDIDAVAEDARIRLVDARAHLEELAQRIDQVERERTVEINRVAAQRADAEASPLSQEWADQISALLSVKELRAAQQVLDEGPGASSKLPIDEPVATWPWRTFQLDDVLSWFGPSRRFAPAGFGDYVLDAAGEKLVDAMARPDDGPALIEAVQELIGTDGVVHRAHRTASGGQEITLLVPDEFRLPTLRYLGRGNGLLVTVGGTPPTAWQGENAVWLSTRLSEPPRPESVQLDLSGLLSLLQTDRPRSALPRTTASRRMGLIRSICQQLPVSAVIRPDAFVGAAPAQRRQQLWWLLHALGIRPDGVTVDTLLYESGGHPRVLVQALSFAVAAARTAGAIRIEPDVYAKMRKPGSYSKAALTAVGQEVGDDGLAALCTMIFFSSTGELSNALDNVMADAGIDLSVARLLDVDAVIARLRETRYLIADESGDVRLCECGVTHLIRYGDPHAAAKDALRRFASAETATGQRSADEELLQARLDLEAIEIRLHHERRRNRMLEESLDARDQSTGQLSRQARFIRDDREERDDRQKVEAWRTERVEIDLVRACADASGKIETISDHRVDVSMVRTGAASVIGGRVMLRIALESIIDNAGQAVDANPPGERSVLVRVGPSAAMPGWAEVDIEDNGPGMPAEVRRRLARGEAPVSARHEGEGQGLLGARTLLRQFDGLLEVVDAPSAALGGAHVRFRIPLAGTG
jgi:signal transduction histidine kinase